jgi:hypothetical protein
MVLPGTGKSFDQFRFDDDACRQYATAQIGGTSTQEAANNAAVKNAAVGTAVGAAAGGLMGGNSGAGVGAGMGLVVGALTGADAGNASSYSLQRRYDIAYEQCMYAKGHQIPMAASRYRGSAGRTYAAPPPPPPGTPPPPPPGVAPPPPPG